MAPGLQCGSHQLLGPQIALRPRSVPSSTVWGTDWLYSSQDLVGHQGLDLAQGRACVGTTRDPKKGGGGVSSGKDPSVKESSEKEPRTPRGGEPLCADDGKQAKE